MSIINKGFLGELFEGVVAKRLTLVETITERSNQHEFQGVKLLKSLFGTDDRKEISTKFIWIEAEQSAVIDDGFISWSNVRKGKLRAAEYHLYYNTNAVTKIMGVGDTVFIALRPGNQALVVVVPSNAGFLDSIYWLFGIGDAAQQELALGESEGAATFKDFSNSKRTELDFAARFILDELGIPFELPEAAMLDKLLEKYPGDLPSTKEFAEYARDTCKEVVSVPQEPDHAIMAWLDHEEKLFRRHEYHFLAERLSRGFMVDGVADVDGFNKFSKSVGQRRFSRMGLSLEHHLAAVFAACNIKFTRGAITERTSKPDFVFPGIEHYRNPNFEADRLSMLAAKSSVKDRWRQAIKEADRIALKHVFTLQTGISVQQTDEMSHQKIQLVLPRQLHMTFKSTQRSWLWDLHKFVQHLRLRQ